MVVCLLLAVQSHAQEPIEVVEVIGQTPLGSGIDADKVASNVQKATAEQMREQRAVDLADYMKRNFSGVFINEAQSNPLQPDVQYRGFVASPLLGLPQGIAVYQDGVRINEPFGDTVNWALVPDSAIDSVHLVPGSNPLFGLNALGGSIAIETKDGFSTSGKRAEIYGGSFGRWGLSAEAGGSLNDRFSYFFTGSHFEEDGWRNFSPTEALRLFGKIGWHNRNTSVELSTAFADTDLIGNGAAPVELLEMDRAEIFTRPDQTKNELGLVNLQSEHEISDTLVLTGNAYVRESNITSYNGDDSDFAECESDPGFICEENGDGEELIFDHEGNQIPASDEVIGASVNRTTTKQDGFGFSLQASWSGRLGNHENSFVLGIAYDESDIGFRASTELGALDETRLTIPGGIFVGDSFTALTVRTSNLGSYISNTLNLSDRLALSLSGRFNDTDVRLHDQLGTALDGDHNFNRFNPAIGITAKVSNAFLLYAGYSESSRTPSPVELTCADEDDPCRLPNAFLADPPLKQVVASTFEFGIRGRWRDGSWHAGLFRTTNDDDILFISAGAFTNEGFFANVGQTRRAGVELSIDGQANNLSWFVNYTYLDASFRENLVLPSPHNPASVDGEVVVAPGDRLPLIPDNLFKAGVRISLGSKISVGGEILAGSDFFMRGDEGNERAGIGNHAVLNIRGEYFVTDRIGLFLNVDNVFNQKYESFGLFGEAGDVLGDEFGDTRFFSPAAPRGAWLGLRVEF